MKARLNDILKNRFTLNGNYIIEEVENRPVDNNQLQTTGIFGTKWDEVSKMEDVNKLYEFQFEWFLKLYGFSSEQAFSDYLSTRKVIVDTGCGLGYKADWFARLAPQSLVIGIDISSSVHHASRNFSHRENLFFIQGDIARTPFRNNSIDFVVCDQVIMHTEVPEKTFSHLADITSKSGEFACYVYRKKAVPRELLDDYFRTRTHEIPDEQMWEFSSQLTELGKRLSELNVSFESPEIPLLGIKAGTYDVQRFIYWNFLKCFWKPEWGFDLSKSTNYDWYAPSNAKRFSEMEFLAMAENSKLKTIFFHEEEACYSARFLKQDAF